MKKTIVFSHTKGGVGKSTLTWHIAKAFQILEHKVKILDLDFQQTLHIVNQLDEKENIEVIQSPNSEELVNIFEENEDVLLVDVGGFDSSLNRLALSYADVIVVPISDNITEIIGFKTY